MGQYLGSWAIDDYLTIPAVTHKFSTGEAFAATGNVTLDIYKDDGVGQIVGPVNMTAAFDGVTGLYIYKQQLTAAAGFVQGSSYTAVIKATVDAVAAIDFHTFQIAADVTATATVVGTVDANVIQWNSAAVATPTVAGVPEVDVTHWKGEGAAAVDANGYPKVTIKSGVLAGELSVSAGIVDVNVEKWNTADAGDLAGASDVWNDASCPTRILTAPTNITSDDGEIHNSASGVYITSTGHTAGATVAAVTGTVGGSVASVAAGGISSATFAAGAINAAAIADGAIDAGSIATGAITSDKIAAGAITATGIASNAITADKLAADAIGTSELSDSAVNKIADGVLGRDLATGDADALEARTVRSALRAIRNKFDIVGTTMTVCKEDDTATAWTTEITRAAVFPITGSNPT